MSIRGTN